MEMHFARPVLFLFPALFPVLLHAQEICDNGVDDDGDGLIDLNDTTDCACAHVTAGPSTSLIPNPSFEEQDCIPDNISELSCASHWVQATNATTDYFSTNGFTFTGMPVPPDGGIGYAGAIAEWNSPDPGDLYIEYLGACLNAPMDSGATYSITLDIAAFRFANNLIPPFPPTSLGPIDIAIYGYTSCPTFPFPTNGCPVPFGWVELGRTSYTPLFAWAPLTITFTPTSDIQAMMLGPACDLPPEYVTDVNFGAPYFIFDDLRLGEVTQTVIQDSGSFCTNDRTLIAHPTETGAYQWYLDSVALVGSTDTILNLSALSLSPGSYQFRVNMGDTACSLLSYQVTDDVPPVLHFSATPRTGCASLHVVFSDTTDPDSVSTIGWQFGDGGSSTADDPGHTYIAAGVYDVTLSVTAPNGCVADTILNDWITAYPFPVASFTASVTAGCVGMQVQFTDHTGALGSTYAWTFGDGGTSTVQNPLHVYTQSGPHDVRLTVTTANGCVDDTLMHHLIDTHSVPDVSFTADVHEGCVPFTVGFTNTTPAAQVDSMFWDFGQDSTSNAAHGTATYMVAGVYDVRLSVTDALGCSADTTLIALITAHDRPEPAFTFAPDSGCYPLDVTFVNTTDPSIDATCQWNFGDGGTSSICDDTHTYQEAGLYSVTLRATSAFGCGADTTYANIITVFDHPTAVFSFGPQPMDVFETEQVFVNQSSNDVIAWDWTFGSADPASAHVPDPVVLFPGGGPGVYDVRLMVSNAHSCTDTAAAIVEIGGYFSVYVPNAFTPDGDGVNDGWRPICEDLDPATYALQVFDRWGERIWSSTDASMNWDGQVNGHAPKNEVYTWELQVRDGVQHLGHHYLGHVTVVR